MDPAFVQNVHQLLEGTIAPDTNIIKQATTQLNTEVYKKPECIPALYEIAATSPNQAIRQLAAVELRKRVTSGNGKLWRKTPVEVRNQIKQSSLERMTQEQARIVRHSIAQAVAAIAEIELAAKPPQWPQLIPGLYEAAQSPDKLHRETALFVLFALLDTVLEYMPRELTTLFSLFAKSLHDPESAEVRMTTVRALGKVAENITKDEKHDVKAYQELIVPMLKVLEQAISDQDEEATRHGFDVFETLLIIDTPLVSKNVADLVQLFLAAGGNKELDETIRCGALNVLAWTIRYKQSKVKSLGLAKPIVEALLPIGAEEDPEDLDEDSPSRVALRCLDTLAQSLPPQQVFPALSEQLQIYMAGDAAMRKSALMAFGVSIDGCSEFIRPHVDQLWPVIEGGLRDPELIVRKAACMALGCMCEWLSEECATHHQSIVPILFDLIIDPATQKNAVTCLDSYLEILGDQIKDYLPLLMERLLILLETGTMPVKMTVGGAIGSAAHAAKDEFRPYFHQTIKCIMPLVNLSGSDEEFDLRGVATDSIGTIAESVGAELFRPYFQDMMKASFEALTMDNTRLRESSFIFFGIMAQVFKEEFALYLPQCVPALIASCQQNESADEFLDEAEGGEGAARAAAEAFTMGAPSSSNGEVTVSQEDLDGLLDETEIDLDTLDAMFSRVNSAIAIEKEVAVDTLGELFNATRSAFLPYVEETLKVLISLLDHYYEGIRKAAVAALFQFIKTVYELTGPEEWKAGAQITVPLQNDVKNMVGIIFPAIFDTWKMEDDKGVVITLCSELADAMQKCGPALVEGRLDDIAQLTIAILEKKSLCQQDPDGDDEVVVEGDSSEYESALVSNATDVFGAMATVLGPDFAGGFHRVLPLVAKYMDPQCSTAERSMAVGGFGEMIVGLKAGVTPFTDQLLQIISRGLQDEEADVRSDSAFAAGVLVAHSEQDLSQHYGALVGVLQPFFQPGEGASPSTYNARDNAAGALARMVIKNSGAVPLDQVVPMIASAMPLRYDPLENKAVYASIFTLAQSNPAALEPHLDHLMQAFAYNLSAERADEIIPETRTQLETLVEQLKQSVPDKAAAAGL